MFRVSLLLGLICLLSFSTFTAATSDLVFSFDISSHEVYPGKEVLIAVLGADDTSACTMDVDVVNGVGTIVDTVTTTKQLNFPEILDTSIVLGNSFYYYPPADSTTYDNGALAELKFTMQADCVASGYTAPAPIFIRLINKSPFQVTGIPHTFKSGETVTVEVSPVLPPTNGVSLVMTVWSGSLGGGATPTFFQRFDFASGSTAPQSISYTAPASGGTDDHAKFRFTVAGVDAASYYAPLSRNVPVHFNYVTGVIKGIPDSMTTADGPIPLTIHFSSPIPDDGTIVEYQLTATRLANQVGNTITPSGTLTCDPDNVSCPVGVSPGDSFGANTDVMMTLTVDYTLSLNPPTFLYTPDPAIVDPTPVMFTFTTTVTGYKGMKKKTVVVKAP